MLIPAYNETAALPAVLGELLPFLADGCGVVVAAEDDNPAGQARLSGPASPTGRAALSVGDGRVSVCEGGGGLVGGVLAAANAAAGEWLVVMDGDGQHDPRTVAGLTGSGGGVWDVIVGGTVRAGLSAPRRLLSHTATRAARLRLPAAVNAAVEHPLSGLFAARRGVLIEALTDVSPHGFKALLAVLTYHPDLRVKEVPSVLRSRAAGDSKLSWRVIRADLGTLTRR